MATILDRVEMGQPVACPNVRQKEAPTAPPIEAIRNAVEHFLRGMPDAREVSVTKLALADSETGSWEAEADLYVPNAIIKALGLHVRKEVMDCQTYLLRLDEQANVVAYGLKSSVDH